MRRGAFWSLLALIACAPTPDPFAAARDPSSSQACTEERDAGARVRPRVLPIGDSYTAGFLSNGGWRPFVSMALDIDFVGPFDDTVLRDGQHAGISGVSAASLAVYAPTWIRDYPADIVVIWSTSYNDVSHGTPIADVVNDVASIVEVVRLSGAHPIVCTTTATRDTWGDTLDAYSEALRVRGAIEGWQIADVGAVTSRDALFIEVTDSHHYTHHGYEVAGGVIADAIARVP